jgi:hypothetical protein
VSPRRRTMLIGAGVSLVLFAFMGFMVSNTNPWTIQPGHVANQAFDAKEMLVLEFQELQAQPDSFEADAVNDTANALHRSAARLAGAANQAAAKSSNAQMHVAANQFNANFTNYGGALADYQTADPSPGTMSSLFFAAEDLGIAAAGLEEAFEGQPAAANDLTGVTDSLFGYDVIAFEVLGILLTAAMIGALVIARPLEAQTDESRYSHPTPEQRAESDHISNVDESLARTSAANDSAAPSEVRP